MVLQRLNPTTVGIKSGSCIVQLKPEGAIQIQNRPLEGPGEYDVAGIGAHVFPDYAVIFSEGIRLAVIWDARTKIVFEEEDSSTDIFIFLGGEVAHITSVIKDQDPRLVVLPNQEVADAIAKEDSVQVSQESNYKLTAQTLPTGERVYLILV
jgi:hypothetical protein